MQGGSDFKWYHDRRYVGYAELGMEYNGYQMIDRKMNGDPAQIQTGDAPQFSPNMKAFAATSRSAAGWTGLEGVAIWRVHPDKTERVFFTDALPGENFWRVDRWVYDDCVLVSTVEPQWLEESHADFEEALKTAPRSQYAIKINPEIVLTPSTEGSGCVRDGDQP